ncbi:MAG: hypothetical protein AAGA33_05865, partial [Pseudomonadota bacterium]
GKLYSGEGFNAAEFLSTQDYTNVMRWHEVRLALAQYRELAAFAQFASDLDAATRAQLDRGVRVTELMKQKQYSPLSVAEMALSLFAANEGYLDKVDVEKVLDYEAALHDFAKSNHAGAVDAINASGDYNDEIAGQLTAICDEFGEKGAY